MEGECSGGSVESRVYSRLLRALSTVAWARLCSCGREVLWALPKPPYVDEGSMAFMAWAVLWGPMADAASLRDSYGVDLGAYALALCDLLGGHGRCWSLASSSRVFEEYIRACRGVSMPTPGEEEALAGLVAALAG